MASLSARAKDIILIDQSTWEPWYQQIKGSVHNDFWAYFDPKGTDVCVKPVAPIEPILEAIGRDGLWGLPNSQESKNLSRLVVLSRDVRAGECF